MLKKILLWIVKSSANADKYSLTIKAGIVAVAIYASTASNLFGLPNLTPGSVETLGGHIAQFITAGGLAISSGFTAFGAARKVILTLKGIFSK